MKLNYLRLIALILLMVFGEMLILPSIADNSSNPVNPTTAINPSPQLPPSQSGSMIQQTITQQSLLQMQQQQMLQDAQQKRLDDAKAAADAAKQQKVKQEKAISDMASKCQSMDLNNADFNQRAACNSAINHVRGN